MRDFMSQFWKQLVKYFLAGVLAILPLVVTVAVVIWVSNFLSNLIGPATWTGKVLSNIGVTILPSSLSSYIAGWTVVLFVVLTLGVIVELGAKSLFVWLLEKLFGRIPLVGNIYRTSKQVVEMLDTNSQEAIKGMTAVFCFFGENNGPGILAFLVSPEKYRIRENEYQIVIIPSAPIPFGGAMFFMPVDQIVPAQLPVEGLMSIYVSMGVTAKDFLQPVNGPPSQRLE
jgi:uncharacterized membrane protein